MIQAQEEMSMDLDRGL